MSCSYEIGIMANKDAAKKINEFLDSDETKKNWGRWEKKELSDNSTMYRTWTNNHPSWFTVGKKFLEVLKSLNYSEREKDAFKCIMVSEEGSMDEYFNPIGAEIFGDFTLMTEFNFPESFSDENGSSLDPADAEIQRIDDECDRDTSASVLADLLMDDGNSTYKMFEELACDYHNGSTEYRKGMDRALSIVTGWNLLSIAKQIEEKEKITYERKDNR